MLRVSVPHHPPRIVLVSVPAALAALAALATYACSSNSTADDGASTHDDSSGDLCLAPDGATPPPSGAAASCASPGEPTPGPADTHCQGDGGLITQTTSKSSCCVAGDAGGPGVCPYNATMFGMEGDDDDCKYHVSWTSGAICEGASGVEFTVAATSLTLHGPVTGAYIHPEVFTTTPGDESDAAYCDDRSTHESPSTFEVLAEGPPGTYSGRIVFDQSGAWTVRFHLFESCFDVRPDSPHGHAAFHVTVP